MFRFLRSNARSHRSSARFVKPERRGHRHRLRFEQLEPRAMMAVDSIMYWNDIALQTVSIDHSFSNLHEQFGPTRASRALAIASTAMFDAINSIKGQYEPFLIKVVGVQGANIDAAVGEAAHDTLVALYPKQKATLDADLITWLNQIPNSKSENLGIALGKTVAQAILAARANDGSTAPSTYQYTGLPGHHATDPVTLAESGITQKPLDPQWGNVTPFGINSSDAFLPPPPPALTSQAYTDAYNEMLNFSADKLTAEQKQIGIFWAYDGTEGLCAPPRLYNQIARVIAVQQGNSEYQNARMFAMMNVAMADAGIVGWDGKYTYDLWRPVVAIRNGDLDGNPNTVGDPTWTPLGAPASNETLPNDFTPPFPSYPSGHAIFGGAVFHTLALFYGRDDIAFSFTSDEFNGTTTNSQGVVRPTVTRSFTSFSQASQENAISRLYLGIHWDFDLSAGIDSGNRIANYIFSKEFEPMKKGFPSGSSRDMLFGYSQSLIDTRLMQLQDGVHRQVVMLDVKTTKTQTVYSVSSMQVLFPTPHVSSTLHRQTILTVRNVTASQSLVDDLIANLV